MIALNGYVAIDKIAGSAHSVTYRARRLKDERPVLLKVLRAGSARTADIARFKHRYERLVRIDDPCVVKVFGVEEHGDGLVVVQEEGPSDDLTGLLAARGTLPLPLFLDAAIALAHAAAAIHRHGLSHHDIRPRNVLVFPDLSLKLGGFGADAEITRENEELYDPRVLAEVLPYVSPEQTGRMNRGVDERSDLYSLGVVYYEMLAGRRPFEASDPMELIHAHLALPPAPLHPLQRQDPALFAAVASIVAKLLAKDAEERYQSAEGLALDLEECRRALDESSRLQGFSAGQSDRKDLFQIHQQLYGREGDIAALVAAFEGVLGGKREIVLVSGYSGIGKSTLVQEILKPLAREKGYYLSGKFDQYNRDTPYSAVIQAFNGLVRQLLTESEERIERHKKALLEALGANASVVCDVVPSLRHLLGATSPAPALGPVEAQSRLNLCFSKLVAAFARSSHPLALFLDDLQWIDSASLGLLCTILADDTLEALFFCGAYRDNEVSPGHPFIRALTELKREGLGVCDIVLLPLARPHVLALLSDSLRRRNCEPLADAILKRTGGNPFFAKRFIKSLHENGALTFVAGKGFHWDLAKIDALAYSDNVVDLMVRTIERLPLEAQEGLKLAAAIGNRFDLEMLSVVSECSPEVIYARLDPALTEGLVAAVGSGYRIVHDKIQEAAYSMIPAAERPAFHLRVGRLLAKRLEQGEDQDLFDVVSHLNSAGDLVSDPEERLALARMNLKAATRAEESAAFGAVLRYLEHGLVLLPADAWASQYHLRLEFTTKKGVMQSLSDQHDDALATLAGCFDNARGRLHKTEVRRRKMNVQILKADLPAALEEGLVALRAYDIHLPPYPDDSALTAELERTMAMIGDRPIASLVDLPPLNDPEIAALQDVLQEMFSPTYLLGTNNFGITVMKVLQSSLRYGLSKNSIYAYVNFGVLLCGRLDVEKGLEFGRAALRLNEIHPDKKSEAMLWNMWGAFVQHWTESYTACKASLRRGLHAGLETGQYIWSFYSASSTMMSSLLMGRHLPDILEEATLYAPLCRLDKFNAITWLVGATADLCEDLRAPAEGADRPRTPWVDRDAVIAEARRINNRVDFYFLDIFAVIGGIFRGAYEEVAEIWARTDPEILSRLAAWQTTPAYYFYGALALSWASETAAPELRETYLARLRECARKVDFWAEIGPQSFRHRALILKAEVARVEQRGDVGDLYDQGIAAATEGQFLHDGALANELTARHYLALGRTTIARGYLIEAARLYDRWGAKQATSRLAREFSNVIPSEGWGLPTSVAPGAASAASALDVASALKASQAIAGEIVLPRLIEQLLRIIVENAGARRGILILKRDGKLLACAEHRAGEAHRLDPTPLDERTDLAVSVAHYVARTEEDVLLDERAAEGPFGADPYLADGAAKSTLVSPVVHNGRLTGVLYLENDLTARAFTPERVELVRLLSAQVAASIENAELYAELERKVEERTLELRRANEEILALHSAEQGRKDAEMAVQRAMIEHQEEVIHALLAPVLEVWDGVLAVPLVGELDDLRAAAITENLLARVVGGRCQFVILDLTGVELVDARTADMLVRIVQSLRLLGAKTIVTGIGPRVAQTLIAAGANLDGMLTRANLREGLRYCLGVRSSAANGART